MMLVGIIFSLLVLLGSSEGHPAEDEIIDLPGLDFDISFRHFSGYLNGTEGNHLHYWFTETQGDPAVDPLILWLNGGPGCSSLDGLLTENGPYLTKQDGSGLYENPYGWNIIGSVIYLESPVCVGFSYDDNATCNTGDHDVAENNYLALQHFFEKFPEYRQRDFYITGESYAGIYIPTLIDTIILGNDSYPINLQGFAIGNGLTSYKSNENSLMFFGHYHALLGSSLWTELVDRCCDGIESRATCNFWPNISTACEASFLKATDILYNEGVNMYNIYTECETPPVPESSNRDIFDKLNHPTMRKVHPEPYLEPACTDSSPESTWLNSLEVREALHIPPDLPDWEICSQDVNRHYRRQVYKIHDLLTMIHDRGIRGLIYNGDVDMACNFIGNLWDIEDLEFALLEDRRSWSYGGQVAGFVKRFDLLDFLTVRGSGHMVPTDKPAEALKMLSSFINKEPY